MLCVYGGAQLDLAFENGRLTQACVRKTQGDCVPLSFVYGDKRIVVSPKIGEAVQLVFAE